jgi:multisubunit Na+/H+ antiporter MnhB subunit
MKFAAITGITILVILIVLYEWPKMKPKQKKEKAAFLTVTGMGWILAVILVFNPDIPGPTQMIDALYRPLGKMLEK